MITDRSRLRSERWTEEGVRCVALPDLLWGRLRSGWDPWNATRLASFLRNQRPDLIHVFETRPAVILPVLAMHRRTPLITDWVDWWGGPDGVIAVNRPRWYRSSLGWVEAWFETAFRARASAATVICEPLGQRALALGVPDSRLATVRNGTDPEAVPSRSVEQCRGELSLDVDGPLLGFASLDSHLDLDIVLNMLKLVRADHPTVKLLVTGQRSPKFEAAVASHSLEDAIDFTGFVSLAQMYTFLGACDVLLMPLADRQYNVGRWPGKFSDYVTVGRPIVTNRVGDAPEALIAADCGLIAEWDPADFAARVNALLDDPALAARLGANGRALAEGDLHWSRQIDVLEELYERVADRS